MNKKAKLIFLALPLLGMTLAGCGDNNDSSDTSGSTTSESSSSSSSQSTTDTSDTSSSSVDPEPIGIEEIVSKPSSVFKGETIDPASIKLRIKMEDGSLWPELKNAESVDLDTSTAHHGDVLVATAHFKSFTKDFNITYYEPSVLNSVFNNKNFADNAGTWNFDDSEEIYDTKEGKNIKTNKTSWQEQNETYPQSGVAITRNKINEDLYCAWATTKASIKNILRIEVDYFIRIGKNSSTQEYEGKGRGPISISVGETKLTEQVEQIKDPVEAVRLKTFKFDFSETKPSGNIRLEALCEPSAGAIVINAVRIYSIVEQTGIFMLSAPTKSDYVEGEKFSSNGLIVVPAYSDGSHGGESQALAYTLEGIETETALSEGNYNVTIKVDDYTLVNAFTVTVREPGVTLESVTISGDMTRKSYVVGENWDTTGLVITANYSNDDQKVLLHSQVSFTFDPEKATDSSVTSLSVTATYLEVSSAAYPVTNIKVIEAEYEISITASDLAPTGSNPFVENIINSSDDDFQFKVKANNTASNFIGFSNSDSSYPGLITDKSNGKAKTVTISWNAESDSTRKLYLYAKNAPYGETTDLQNNTGDKVHEFVFDADNLTQTFTFTDTYHYVGLFANDGAVKLDSISMTFDRSDKPLELQDFEVSGTPVVKVYDEQWDLSPVVVYGTYQGLSANITSCFEITTSTPVPSEVSTGVDVVVTATYKFDNTLTKTVTLKGNVNAPDAVLSGVTYSGKPDKVDYLEGETFDPTGITVTAAYTHSDFYPDESIDLSTIEWSTLALGDTSVTGTVKNPHNPKDKKTITVTGITVTSNVPVAASLNIADFVGTDVKGSKYTLGNVWGDDNWEFDGCSNNKAGWNYIKFGAAGNGASEPAVESSGYIATKVAITSEVTSIKMLVNAETTISDGKKSYVSLIVASDASFETVVDTITEAQVTKEEDITFTPSGDYGSTKWATGLYFKIVVRSEFTTKSNGGLVVNGVTYYA